MLGGNSFLNEGINQSNAIIRTGLSRPRAVSFGAGCRRSHFYFFVYRIIQRAARAVDQILAMLANDELDFSILIDRLHQDAASGWRVESVTLIGIACCWLLAIGHAYFSGKKIDQQPR
jgi:hypothetical protein